MRLKESFFDDDAIKILEAMPDGYLYSNILLKLYLKSLKFNGRLMYNERIPYNASVLATLTNHSVGVIEKALDIFEQLGLIEVLDNGAIYMLDIQNYIGKSTTEADRKRDYRNRIDEEKKISRVQITIHEGKNRQVRKMCEAIGKRVLALHRCKIGNLDVKDLKLGEWRYLSKKEVENF